MIVNLNFFYQQIIANWLSNANETVRFLKYVKRLGFFREKVFFEKLDFFKIGKR